MKIQQEIYSITVVMESGEISRCTETTGIENTNIKESKKENEKIKIKKRGEPLACNPYSEHSIPMDSYKEHQIDNTRGVLSAKILILFQRRYGEWSNRHVVWILIKAAKKCLLKKK